MSRIGFLTIPRYDGSARYARVRKDHIVGVMSPSETDSAVCDVHVIGMGWFGVLETVDEVTRMMEQDDE